MSAAISQPTPPAVPTLVAAPPERNLASALQAVARLEREHAQRLRECLGTEGECLAVECESLSAAAEEAAQHLSE